MSPYGRWRHSEIVAPPSISKGISGGIKNALERGEPLSKVKQSFVNAGYTPQEVQAATQIIRKSSSGIIKPLNSPNQASPQSTPLQSTPTQIKKPSQGTSKKTIIILVIVGVVILAVALFLGLFWNKIF